MTISKLEIGMGGNTIEVSEIFLYPYDDVARWRSLMDEARQKMGGAGTGIGFLGSPEWVLGGVILLGALEKIASNKNDKDGFNLLEQAATAYEKIISNPWKINIKEIDNIDRPNPSMWKSYETIPGRFVDLQYMSFGQRMNFIDANDLSRSDIVNGGISLNPKKSALISLPDEFVTVVVSGHVMHVKWSSVDTYRVF